MLVLAGLAAVSFLIWLAVLLHPYRPYLPFHDEGEESRPGTASLPSAPLVSIIVPARNEEETIGAALRSHADSAWTRREIILVDDASTDHTAEIAREIARNAPCLLQVRPRSGSVPEGWVGKVNAMAAGLEEARGEFVLFTDADIVWQPELLGELVAESREFRLALNSRMVLLAAESFWERLLVPAFVCFFGLLYPFRAVERQRSRTAAAAGGCMLVERAALDRAGGVAEIRSAIIDDIALARLMKGTGHRIRLRLTRKARSLRRYRRLGDFWRTVTRTAFTELEYSYLRLAAATVALCAAFLVPPAAVVLAAVFGDLVPGVTGAAALGLCWALYLPTVRYLRVPWPYALLAPAAGLLYLCMTWHSAIGYAAGRRSSWKGREYRR